MNDGKTLSAKYIIDASGNAQWLRKTLDLRVYRYSQPLVAKYGYTSIPLHSQEEPLISLDNNGWQWYAKINDQLYQWTEMSVTGNFKDDNLTIDGMKYKGADVTWRIVDACAGQNYFITGEAAYILDPGASNGVLRSLYSGVMAADCIAQILHLGQDHDQQSEGYKQWMRDRFFSNCDSLTKLYAQHQCQFFFRKYE